MSKTNIHTRTRQWLRAIVSGIALCMSTQGADAQTIVGYGPVPTVVTPPPAIATAPGEPKLYDWVYSIEGVRASDALTKYVMNGEPSYSTAINKHCNSKFLFTVYEGDTVKLKAFYNMDDMTRASWGFPIPLFFRVNIDLIPANLLYSREDSAFEEGRELIIHAFRAGYFTVKYRAAYGTDDSLVGREIEARFLVLKRAEKLTVEAEEICAGTHPSGQDFRFKVLSDPPLQQILPVRPLNHSIYAGSSCQPVSDLNMSLDFTMTAPDAGTVPVRSVLSATPSVFNNFELGASPHLWPATWGQEQQFYFKNSEFASYVSAATAPVLGQVSFHDGYLTSKDVRIFIPVKAAPTTPNYNNAGAYFIQEYVKTTPSYLSGATAHPYGTLIAPDHETWTPTANPMVSEGYGSTIPVLQIKDKIVIGKGQSLTIRNMTLEMGKDAQIIVESDPAGIQEAGFLYLDHTTIKGFDDCGHQNTLWNGIVLQGNTAKTQAAIGGVFGKRYQAILHLSHATIADARVAVRTYDPAAATTRSGGLVYAYNSTFSNNLVAVDMAGYPKRTILGGSKVPYLSVFDHCSFLANDGNIAGTFEGFICANRVQGIPVRSCSFTADYSSGADMKGYGIKGSDVGFVVSGSLAGSAPCTFRGLHDAIHISRSSFLAAASLYVTRSDFDYNYNGVYTKGVYNASILFNNFYVPERPGSSSGRACTGITVETGSNFNISDNHFGAVSFPAPNPAPRGNNAVMIWNAGSANNYVQRNTVSNMELGMLSNYYNRGTGFPSTGLQFLCNNQGANVRFCNSASGADPLQDGMRAEQGFSTQPAGNTFSHTLYDFYNHGTQVGAVTYFHNPPPDKVPSFYFGALTTSSIPNGDGCTPYPPLTSSTTGTLISVPYAGISGKLLPEILNNNIAYYTQSYDQNGRSTELHSLFSTLADAYSDLAAVDLYMEDGNSAAANTLYNGIVASRSLSGKEAYEFSHWGRMLLDISTDQLLADKAPEELDPAQLSSLELVAGNAQMWARVRAQNWLSSYDGRSFSNTFLYPVAGNMRTTAEESILAGTAANGLYPNPATDHALVNYIATTEYTGPVYLQLEDVLGRTLLRQQISTNGSQRIALDKLAPGVYFYTIHEQNTVTLSGKLIKQ